MCPHTTFVRIPHTANVSPYLILHMRPHTSYYICVRIQAPASQPAVCVLILHTCPHTGFVPRLCPHTDYIRVRIQASYYIRVLIQTTYVSADRLRTTYVSSYRLHTCPHAGFGFTADLWPYLVLQHCGTPLRAVLEKTRVHVPSLAQQLLEALECVHMLGLSHNDLTWDNVMLLPLPPPALAGQKTKGGARGNAKVAGVAAAAAEHVRRQWRGERSLMSSILTWNCGVAG
jgi:hypothetical protein